MGRRIILGLLLLLCTLSAVARHIAGGELYYRYLGTAGAGQYRYEVTVRLFRECSSNGPRLEAERPVVGAYNAVNLQLTKTTNLNYVPDLQIIRLKASAIPCISGDTSVCYQIAYYKGEIILPALGAGYVLAWNPCCRAENIANVNSSGSYSATYLSYIPGNVPTNNSPEFNVKDTALICSGKQFRLDFGATDADGDSLSYGFSPAYGLPQAQSGSTPTTLRLSSLVYTGAYSGAQPLGNQVTINPVTGVISGTAPFIVGRLVVGVMVTEWRHGQAINTHRKDFMIKISDCDYVDAQLDPIVSCQSFDVPFENHSASSSVTRYEWSFGDPASGSNSSQQPTPVHTYSDTGIFIARLTVYDPAGCKAEDTTTVKVYPGFNVDFAQIGRCYKAPVAFNDRSSAVYGQLNSWQWDFGVPGITTDTSVVRNPIYQYTQPAEMQVRLIVSSTKGCIDTVFKTVTVSDEPDISLPAQIPLCRTDSIRLPLVVQGSTATYAWSPPQFIDNVTIAQPLVWPGQTQTYSVVVQQDGCEGRRSIQVRVINAIQLTVGKVDALCQGDTGLLQVVSEANVYRWEPPDFLQYPDSSRTRVWPDTTTTYTVYGNLGSCRDTATVTVRVDPAPSADAGRDTVICAGQPLVLQGRVVGNSFAWMPDAGTLSSPTVLNPVARPGSTISYMLVVFGNQGCSRLARDTMTVRVNPLPRVFAGNDTNVVMGKPLQLRAAGADKYQWFPAYYFSGEASQANPRINLPVGVTPIALSVKGTSAAGCVAYDTLIVKQFDGLPEIYVPTAFTPNADGRNDVLRAIPAGVQFRSFRVYNRLGVQVFATANPSEGWNGVYKGQQQPSGAYVFIAEGVDGEGVPLIRKGTSVLIR